MAWTLKSGTIPDKVTALVVYDTSVSEMVDLGDKGGTETNGGITITDPGSNVVKGTTGSWGDGIYLKGNGVFTPAYIQFESTYEPTVSPRTAHSGAGYTVMMIVNDLATGDLWPTSGKTLWRTTSGGEAGLCTEDSTGYFSVGFNGGTQHSTSTTTAPLDTAFAVAATVRRHASATDNEVFYTTYATSNFASISPAAANTDDGNDTTLYRIGSDSGAANIEIDLFMLIIFDGYILAESEMDTIIADPLGTLVDTGAASITPQAMYHYSKNTGSGL